MAQANASNQALAELDFGGQMHRTPSITLAPGNTVGQFVANGTTLTSLAFERITRSKCMLRAAHAGAMTANSLQELYWASPGAGALIINTEDIS
jgi:hypothetical protein